MFKKVSRERRAPSRLSRLVLKPSVEIESLAGYLMDIPVTAMSL